MILSALYADHSQLPHWVGVCDLRDLTCVVGVKCCVQVSNISSRYPDLSAGQHGVPIQVQHWRSIAGALAVILIALQSRVCNFWLTHLGILSCVYLEWCWVRSIFAVCVCSKFIIRCIWLHSVSLWSRVCAVCVLTSGTGLCLLAFYMGCINALNHS